MACSAAVGPRAASAGHGVPSDLAKQRPGRSCRAQTPIGTMLMRCSQHLAPSDAAARVPPVAAAAASQRPPPHPILHYRCAGMTPKLAAAVALLLLAALLPGQAAARHLFGEGAPRLVLSHTHACSAARRAALHLALRYPSPEPTLLLSDACNVCRTGSQRIPTAPTAPPPAPPAAAPPTGPTWMSWWWAEASPASPLPATCCAPGECGRPCVRVGVASFGWAAGCCSSGLHLC